MPARYSRIQIILHWAVVGLILVQYVYPDGMEAAWRGFRRTGEAVAGGGAWLHIACGVLILVFALWRLALRVTRGVPPQPAGGPALLRRAADLTHWALYALILLVPLSGLFAWFGGIGAAGEAHEVLKSLLLILAILHVAAALYHQLFRRDRLLARMGLGRGA